MTYIGTALRRLASTPGFTAMVLLSVAVVAGFNLLIFGFTSPVILKALPFPESDRLLDVTMAPPGRPEARSPLTHGMYVHLRDKATSVFEAIGVFDAGRPANIAGDATGMAERVGVHRMSATGFAALGAPPLFGRLPLAADEQASAPETMVSSYALWQKRFGGRADVVGQAIQVDGRSVQLIGVMPEGFGLLDNFSDAWLTSGLEPAPGQEGQRSLRAIARLKSGVSLADAQAGVKVALDEYASLFPDRDKGWTVELAPYRQARLGGLSRPLTMVQLGVGALLVILCVPLAALLRARSEKGNQSGVPAAGPARPGVVLVESVLLAIGGTALGAVACALTLPGLRELTPAFLPRLNEVAFDGNSVGLAVVLVVIIALVLGVVPAWAASRARSGARGSALRDGLGVVGFVVLLALQLTLAFVVLTGANLAVRAYAELRGRDIGIDPAGLLSFDVHLPRDPYVRPDVARVGSIEIAEYNPAGAALYDRVRAALASAPGVVQAAAVGTQPFAAAPFVQAFVGDVELTPDNQINVQFLAVTENYFNTMGIRLLRGRDFSATDRPDSPWVVLVNETMAKQHWPDAEAVGQRLTLTFHPDDGEAPREVIGVVADTLPFRGASEVPPLIYLLHRQQSAQQRASIEGRRTVMSFLARTSGDPLAFRDAVKPLVNSVDAAPPVGVIRTVESFANAGQVALLDYGATLLGLVAFVSVVIGGVGTYAFAAARRARGRVGAVGWIGAVVALGVGAAVGRAIWLRFADVIASFLTNVSVTPSDPLLLAGAFGVLAAAVVIALVAASFGRRHTSREERVGPGPV